MARHMGRTLIAVFGSAGLLLGGGLSASASAGDDGPGHHGGHGKGQQYGYVSVCQDVAKDDYDGGAKDDNSYASTYQVRDSYGQYQKVYLQGRYGCSRVKVHKGNVAVKVIYTPSYIKLYGDVDRYVDVKKDRYTNVTYKYRAVNYGYVTVCQDVAKDDYYGDKPDYNAYSGTYQVKDRYGQVQKLYLKGRYACESVKVYTGPVAVNVLYQPDYTRLYGEAYRYVDVYKGKYAKVDYDYQTVSYGYVKVCQNVVSYHNGGYGSSDTGYEYAGSYAVTEDYADAQDVYLKGTYACDEVKVYAGKVKVSVLYKPEHTAFYGRDDQYVDVYRGYSETVTYDYKAVEDDYSVSVGHHAA